MSCTGRGRVRRGHARGGRRRDRRHRGHRARADARRRPRDRGGDGGSQAAGVLLMDAHGPGTVAAWRSTATATAPAARRPRRVVGARAPRSVFRRLTERPADLLRFATAGSVDDGKSTLIGRLLYDSKQVLADQLAHVEQASQRMGHDFLDLSLLTDGLRAEREQGITIDVAYRYFATAQRRFIIADTPGHEQYTRNMVTGASTADLAIVLVDARKGVVAQSKRHAFISSLLGIPHVVVCVNKMDLVDFDEDVVRRDRRGVRRVRGAPGDARRDVHPDLGAARRQRRRALGGDALVPGAAAALPPRARPHRLRPQPDRRALPGAVGDPPAGRASVADYRAYAGQVAGGDHAPGRRGGRAAGRAAHRRSRASTRSRARSRRRSRRCRSRCG